MSDNAFLFCIVVAFFALTILAFVVGQYWLAAVIIAGFLFLLYLDDRATRT